MEPDLSRRGLERNRVVVRHGDVQGGAVEVLRPGCAANGAISGLPSRSRSAEAVFEYLQLTAANSRSKHSPPSMFAGRKSS